MAETVEDTKNGGVYVRGHTSRFYLKFTCFLKTLPHL